MTDEFAREPGLVAATVYAKGVKVAEITVHEAGQWASRPGHVVWIGLFEPKQDVLALLSAQLRLHPLAVEDAEKAHQFPKIEEYDNSLFIAARTAQMVGSRVAFGETSFFVGKGYVVTVRHGASQSYALVRARCEAEPKRLAEGEDFILYALLDFIVDNYLPVLRAVDAQVEEIEDIVFDDVSGDDVGKRIYTLRRDLLRLRNAAAPLVDVCRKLERSDVVPVDPAMRPHFRDVTDHVRRVAEGFDTLREVLAFAFEASLMNAQMQQTAIARRLAAWAAILAVPTAIAGIYGMNFQHMPELEWRFGYPAALAVIAGVCGWLYARLRRAGWL